MVGGLGIEDQTNGFRYVHKFIPCGVVWFGPKTKPTGQNPQHLTNWSNTCEIPLPLFPLTS